MPIRLRGGGGGSAPPAEAVATRNILNGVLSCAWDKTSAVPKLLEIYNGSFVKLNIDADNPLALAFANGWDDKDRPAQVVKSLTTAPANIDLSGKANCHVQIVAKVINGELVITTHDIYDPAWETWTDIVPNFTSAAAKDGWSFSCDRTAASGHDNYMGVDGNGGTYRYNSGNYSQTHFYLTAPFATLLAKWRLAGAGSGKGHTLYGKNLETGAWTQLDTYTPGATGPFTRTLTTFELAKEFQLYLYDSGGSAFLYDWNLYEFPTAKFYRGLNKVKDRSDAEALWINLGYATVDAAGAITALNHYTDLRNNYPGGMRVEA